MFVGKKKYAMQRAKCPKGVHILADFSYYVFHVMFFLQIFQCIIGFHTVVVLINFKSSSFILFTKMFLPETSENTETMKFNVI